ncbi:MAG: SDR family oxidoreductase [Clostridiales bacterium]|nr:SDR family oxidoreductase [Clostridiales bacterium]
MKKFILGMISRGVGNIINISSIHAVQSRQRFGIYAATKGAMNAIGRAAAIDYADKGIRVNTIAPGLIMSDNMIQFVESYPKGTERDNIIKVMDEAQLLKPGKSEDVANAALYLASDMSNYVTGQVLMVDGGASITIRF